VFFETQTANVHELLQCPAVIIPFVILDLLFADQMEFDGEKFENRFGFRRRSRDQNYASRAENPSRFLQYLFWKIKMFENSQHGHHLKKAVSEWERFVQAQPIGPNVPIFEVFHFLIYAYPKSDIG